MKSFGGTVRRCLDECKMAGEGILLATRDWRFVVTVIISFILFGTLMNLLSGSTAALDLFWRTDLTGKFTILKDAFLGLFGVGRNSWDFLLTFCIVVLQSFLLGLVVVAWQQRRQHKKDTSAKSENADNLQSAGLVTGLAVLGSGCPTCGTTLLAPIISAFFSNGLAFAGIISGMLTVLAIIVAFFALKKLGREVYVMYCSKRYLSKKIEKGVKSV